MPMKYEPKPEILKATNAAYFYSKHKGSVDLKQLSSSFDIPHETAYSIAQSYQSALLAYRHLRLGKEKR